MPILLKRICYVIFGSLLLGAGISLAILSGFGGDAISVFSEGLAKTLGITLGQASLVYYAAFCIPVLYIDRRQIGIGTILSPVICSIVIDIVLLYCPLQFTSYAALIIVVIGVSLIGIGLAIYIYGDIGRSSYDACILMVSHQIQKPIAAIKMAGDFLLCAIGFVLGGTIGLGPVLAILLIGPILQKTLSILQRKQLL